MPRDIPVGNGRLLITFDHQYQIRDLYFPHVGQENHAGAGPCRFGVFSDIPGPGGTPSDRGRLFWSSEGWTIRQRYLKDTLTTSVTLDHEQLRLAMNCNDAVDFHRNIMVRKIRVKNLADHERLVRIIHHHDFNMLGTKIGDTAYYDPDLKSLVHYRGKRYIAITFFSAGEQRIDEYATGTSGFHGAEGTWRDAEDGHLQGNPIAQGAVDSTIAHHVKVDSHGEATVHMALITAESREELLELHKWLVKMGPQTVVDRTTNYWRLWAGGTNINFGNLPPKVVDLFKRSLLVVRTQIDNGGAIIAANDSDYLQFSRDTYSYMWPRDGALVADALDLAGFPDIARSFYLFCRDVLTEEGYFYHKYNPDGSPASSWHPWVMKPTQEDETTLVGWALWRHYYRYRDIEFIRPLWVDVVQKAADFMVKYRDPRTGLPLPSYDLWEERWGVHAFTVATVYAGLKAARNFAVAFGDRQKAEVYNQAAEEVRAGAEKYLWSDKLGRFVRRLVPKNDPTPPDAPDYAESGPLSDPALAGGDGYPAAAGDIYEVDEVLDASLWAIYKFHLFEVDDPRVEATMKAVNQKLWVKTPVGGVARYENDYYHRVSNDIAAVPGNPWFICTLWLADYFIGRAKSTAELKLALPIFEWTAGHALESGVLAEQVNPYTNEPLSVSPLTWSHATVVSTCVKYLEKLEALQTCGSCSQPMFRLRRRGLVELHGHVSFNRFDAEFTDTETPATTASLATFDRVDPKTARKVAVRLAIDTRDCIGCEVCVAHCDKEVLRSVDGKAQVDVSRVNDCDLDGHCVTVCPTDVVTLTIEGAAATSGDDRMPATVSA